MYTHGDAHDVTMEAPDWDKIYLQLFTYARQLLKVHHWFRGPNCESTIAGKEAHDYVIDAIEKYLKEPEKFDPTRGRSLLNYLKLHIIKQSISNDSKSLENRTSSNTDQFKGGEDDDENFVVSVLPHFEAHFGDEIDLKQILNKVSLEVRKDAILSKIFDGASKNVMKRREIIKEYDLSETEYDNGFKRLTTILKRIAKKFDLTSAK
jgi:hypothetical protein